MMTAQCLCGFVALTFVLVASPVESQQHALDRGSIQVGGSASLTSTGSDDDDQDERITTLGLNPRLHYFVAERLAIGADLVLSYTKLTGGFTSRTIGIGPAVTYYFGASDATVHPYVSARASFADVTLETPFRENDGSRRSATAAGGILSMISRTIGVTTELFYMIDRQSLGEQSAEVNTFGLAVGIAAFVF